MENYHTDQLEPSRVRGIILICPLPELLLCRCFGVGPGELRDKMAGSQPRGVRWQLSGTSIAEVIPTFHFCFLPFYSWTTYIQKRLVHFSQQKVEINCFGHPRGLASLLTQQLRSVPTPTHTSALRGQVARGSGWLCCNPNSWLLFLDEEKHLRKLEL